MAITDKLTSDIPLTKKIPLCKKEYGITSLIIGLSLFSIGYFLFTPKPIISIEQYMIGIGIGAVMVLLYLGSWVSTICFADHFKGTIQNSNEAGFKTGATITFFVILSIMLLVYYYPWGFVVESNEIPTVTSDTNTTLSITPTQNSPPEKVKTIEPVEEKVLNETQMENALYTYAMHITATSEVTINGMPQAESSHDPAIFSNIMIGDLQNTRDNLVQADPDYLNHATPNTVKALNSMDCPTLVKWRFTNYNQEADVYASRLIKTNHCYSVLFEKMEVEFQ